MFFNVKKGPIQGSICFKLIPGLLVLIPLFKMALSMASSNRTKGSTSSCQNWCKITPEDGGIPKVAPSPPFPTNVVGMPTSKGVIP